MFSGVVISNPNFYHKFQHSITINGLHNIAQAIYNMISLQFTSFQCLHVIIKK